MIFGAHRPESISVLVEGSCGIRAASCINEYRLAVSENYDVSDVVVVVALVIVTALHSEVESLRCIGALARACDDNSV